ncbi:6894_t:CDS:1 [Funneliformis caledonium]|uniref:6894_t:CDS:1 n=1 Tax=Funneliformis caledonium TaxID=1117310 RepID=A0A9N8Z6D1_9GLOM|nr:6894_t:CDS:1 [Funneliformis caledonium]
MESNNPSQNNNDYLSNINYGYSHPMMNNNRPISYGNATSSLGNSNLSSQPYPSTFPSHAVHANAIPPPSANNNTFLNMATNPIHSNTNIFSFDIPGFKIIIIPVDNNSSNNFINNSQSQFQQSFNNCNNFSG